MEGRKGDNDAKVQLHREHREYDIERAVHAVEYEAANMEGVMTLVVSKQGEEKV